MHDPENWLSNGRRNRVSQGAKDFPFFSSSSRVGDIPPSSSREYFSYTCFLVFPLGRSPKKFFKILISSTVRITENALTRVLSYLSSASLENKLEEDESIQ